MDEVAVDIDEAGPVGSLLDQVVVPNLVVERFLSVGHSENPMSGAFPTPVQVLSELTEAGRRGGACRRSPASVTHAKAVHGDMTLQKPPGQAGPVVNQSKFRRMAISHGL
jgi:hypothetical protein